MSDYRCTNSFKSDKGVTYNYGDRISENEYSSLWDREKAYFQKEDIPLSSMGSPYSIATGDILGTGIFGGVDMDPNTLL